MEGRDTLIERNIGLVYAQLNRFNLRQDPDAESIAFEALLKASENFDESTGNKFSTLAVVSAFANLMVSILMFLPFAAKAQWPPAISRTAIDMVIKRRFIFLHICVCITLP